MSETSQGPGLRWPSLLAGIGIMLGITIYPLGITHADGSADHGMATLLCWAMAAGIVHGVGYVPRFWLWRWLLSGWAGLLALVGAVVLKLT